MEFRLADLAERINARLDGDPDAQVHRLAPLYRAGPGDLTFVASPKLLDELRATRAGVVILKETLRSDCPVSALISDDPYLAYARAATLIVGEREQRRGIHTTAFVDPDARIHPEAWVGPQCVIEADARIERGVDIGPHCLVGRGTVVAEWARLVARVTLCDQVHIGQRTLLHPGVVIGADGFGFAREGERWVKIPQIGGVRIGADVEIGCNTTIDRGTLEDTVIEDGVKLDNQIQVGHNAHIGPHTAAAACVGISGSTRIGRGCTIGGAAGIAGHLEIVDGVHVGAMAAVSKSLTEPGAYASGTMVEPHAKWRRNSARFRHLDELARRVMTLETRLKRLDEHEDS